MDVESRTSPEGQPQVAKNEMKGSSSRSVAPVSLIGEYIGRFGTFMLRVPADTAVDEAFTKKIDTALRADARIKEISDVRTSVEWNNQWWAYPFSGDALNEDLLSRGDAFQVAQLSDPIVFTVSVPIRNQPAFRGYTDIPTDTYAVAWDGLTAFVMWKREPDVKFPPRAGGQVVVEVLTDVAKAAGFELYVQPCSPYCQNLFAHSSYWVHQFAGQGQVQVLGVSDVRGVDIAVAVDGGPLKVVEALAYALKVEAGTFAQFKNWARRILDIETMSRVLVDELLQLQFKRNERKKLSAIARWKAEYSAKQSRHRSEELIASLWLAFARVEALKSAWYPVKDDFFETIDEWETGPLFAKDQKEDVRAVERQDLTFIQAAVEQSATRFDARMVALLTGLSAASALGGALIGVAVS